MNTFQLLITCILLFSLLTFTVLFGHIPALRNSPIGWINHFITLWIPDRLAQLDHLICRGRTSRHVRQAHRRIVHQRHPSVLIMYLVLFLGGVYIFLTRLYFLLPLSHQLFIPLLICSPLTSLYLAASTDPGYVTACTHTRYMTKYEFDGILFRRGHECPTCLREKPARSKHCPLCDKCIAKHDHHCIWINSCVGERNMKWFLMFLLSNSVTFTYAAVTLHHHFSSIRQTLETSDTSSATSSWAQQWLTVLQQDVLLGALYLFVMLCDAMVTSFLLYHSYLIFSGVTTNETLKFEDVREAIKAREVDIYRVGQGRFRLDLAGYADPVPWNDVENVYDQGWKQNMLSIFTD